MGGGSRARWWGCCSSSGDVGDVDEGEVEGGDGGDAKSWLFMTSLASADCFASRRPAPVCDEGQVSRGAKKKMKDIAG